MCNFSFTECQLRDQPSVFERQDVAGMPQLRAECVEEGLLLQLLQVPRGALQKRPDRRQQVPRHTLPTQRRILQENTTEYTKGTPEEKEQTKREISRRSLQCYRLRWR